MKEKPIIFSAPMVRAILSGRKTQTRRIIKPQPNHDRDFPPMICKDGSLAEYRDGERGHRGYYSAKAKPIAMKGTLLWVRETWSHTGQGVWTVRDARMASLNGKVVYRADEDTAGGWFPSIHMPREFARIFLKVTDVRVQRLQDISSEDAIAEGIQKLPGGNEDQWMNYPEGSSAAGWLQPINSFDSLWESINGEGSWEKNPWVYALTFERVEALENAA